MPTGNDKFNAAANEAGCNFLLAAGGAATQFAAYSLLTGNLVAGVAGAAVAGIGAYAYANNCQWDPDASGPPGPQPFSGCKKFASGCGRWHIGSSPAWENDPCVAEVIRAEYKSYPPNLPNTPHVYSIEWVDPDGRSANKLYTPAVFVEFTVLPLFDAVCEENFDPLPPTIPPYIYTDPDDGCQIQVTFQGWGVDGGGSYGPVWQMDPILPPSARAGGGIIGGCNFNPVIIYQPPGGPPVPPIPVPPNPVPGPGGIPWWVESLLDLLAGVISNIITTELYRLFETPLPAFSRSVFAPCQYKADGSRETFSISFPEQAYTERMLSWQDSLVSFMQQFAEWKTPTCSGGGSSVSGQPVTVTWSSDEPSPASGHPVRKIFTYFDQSGSSQLDHVNWWKDFSWQAGPVIVSVNGTDLGKPQVWAASVDEGKRVIEHAATIAGADMSKAEWIITSPRSARYGLSGTMRVHRSQDGGFWVTKRDGPDGSPLVLS